MKTNICDWCSRTLCEKCEGERESGYYFMRHCDECDETWCHHDGTMCDHPCKKKGSYTCSCDYP